ncbi:cyclic AMP response element-binding protein A-like isoform X2 [Panulirus ornatus]|uniref:cyclic AMP response element-binding protein A-like isoform X2 n=1 Tax=Panulirus ornatus TaxID=150431 RepID=UPI003A84D861
MDILDSTLAEFAENDLKELWDCDYYAEALKVAGDVDWVGVLENSCVNGAAGVVLNDRLMTEASLGVISQLSTLGSSLGSSLTSLGSFLAAHQQETPGVKVEHSYSLVPDRNETASPLSDLESECFPAIPISEAEGAASSSSSTSTTTTTTAASTTKSTTITIAKDGSEKSPSPTTTVISSSQDNTTPPTNTFRKAVGPPPLSPILSQPPSPEPSCSQDTSDITGCFTNALLNVPSFKASMGLVRPSTVVVTQRSGPGVVHSSASRLGLNSLTLRLPSTSVSTSTSSTSISTSDTGFSMPPTPPSCSSSDSECGSHSPTRTPPLYETLTPQFCNPRKSTARITVSSRQPINTPLISSQPKGATGALNLTEEEKRTLLSEGYSIPSRLPLTKAEEKSLKKIRRKIKNKISAQESRRKKKDYMDALERKVEKLSNENTDCKRRIEVLQNSNSQLMLELKRLQNMVEQDEKYRIRSSPIATLLS